MATSPSTLNYVTGGGKCEIRKWVAGVAPSGAWAHMGNVPKFECQPNIEKLDHNSSQGGTLEKNKSVVQSKGATLSMELEENTAENMALFFMATIVSENDIRPLEEDEIECEIKFTPDYAVGNEWICDFWKCSVSPSGALAFINMGAWMNAPLTLEVLSDRANHPSPESAFWGMTRVTV